MTKLKNSKNTASKNSFDPLKNYELSRKKVGYIPLHQANHKTYDAIGFMSGLEVHQQLLTKKKLFCHCPAGIYNTNKVYDAEVIRHMRPTLSELGEYDGTALMEFKTRKEIIYRLKNETTCTYEIDDTPPFQIDQEALDIALEIALLSKLNIVGEIHITRKQYLDGSIPTGFQRTAILGVEGEIQLKNKKVRLIQLSIEEDSCREISDVGHVRTYKTDRLGMPLIETVTYPDMINPWEVKEACDHIRFLNRSTGKVRTGIGSGRQDVNVSCRGGTRVEIKGVSHTKWIPKLTHNECFRQWALLQIRNELIKRVKNPQKWSISYETIRFHAYQFTYKPIKDAKKQLHKIVVANLPDFQGILSYFTQPGKIFADEISERLKVIACIEQPNMSHSEAFDQVISVNDWNKIKELLKAEKNDAQIIFWGPEEDIQTALETIEERAKIAFVGVPNESRKSFENGTTIFERVLPGADRMYPDTDSAPIPLADESIDRLRKNLPTDIIDRYRQMKKWGIPDDNLTYLFKNNLYPLLEQMNNDLKINPRFVGVFLGQRLKFVEGHVNASNHFNYHIIFNVFEYLKKQKIDYQLAYKMLPQVYEYPKMDFDSVLEVIHFKKTSKESIISHISFFKEKFESMAKNPSKKNKINWIMGQLRGIAIGNMDLTELSKLIHQMV